MSERAILVGLELPGRREWTTEESLAELAQLLETAGGKPCATVVQKRDAPDPATFIGPGKVAEIAALLERHGADLVVFDEELSPAQGRNLEKRTGARVLDRTALILDIFAQRARTREGKLQVELAQLNYRLPRLAGRGVELSRLGGGIGTRGPGETKLETDRRRIRARIADLRRELEDVRAHRSRQRAARQRAEWPVVALVGYTNAGKSTLLNALSGAGARAEDRLFATLDPMTRRVSLPGGGQVLVTDTVGFIQKLPAELVAAFRATLEEVGEADLICHVVNAASPKRLEQQATVVEVLRAIGAGDVPTVLALNQIDRLSPAEEAELVRQEADAVRISALRRTGLEQLLLAFERALSADRQQVRLTVPYAHSHVLALLRRRGRVVAERYGPAGVQVEVELARAWIARVRRLLGEGRGGREDANVR